jgi:hypothetical protein
VVETGTSTFYAAIRDATDEPVLKEICSRIAADEIRHFKLFYRHLQIYQRHEPLPVIGRLKVAFARIRESDDDELASAYHAGTDQKAPYNRHRAAGAYHARALGLYRKRHVRQATRMLARATGLVPDGWVSRLFGGLLWAMIQFRGRKFRAAFSAH